MFKENYEAQVLKEEDEAYEAHIRAEAESEEDLQSTQEAIRAFLFDDASEEEPSGFDPKDKTHAIKRKNDVRCKRRSNNSGDKPWKRRKPSEHKAKCEGRVCASKARARVAEKEFKLETSEI